MIVKSALGVLEDMEEEEEGVGMVDKGRETGGFDMEEEENNGATGGDDMQTPVRVKEEEDEDMGVGKEGGRRV